MTKCVYTDEIKEVSLKELLKPVIDYNSYVSLEFYPTNQTNDQVRITRSFKTRIERKDENIDIHEKVSTVIPCRISYPSWNDGKKPTGAWLSSDAKTFLYMLRTLKDSQYVKFDIWPSNGCDMFKEKGIVQETIIISIHESKKGKEIFSCSIDQIHDTKYEGIDHMYRYKPNQPLSHLIVPETKTECAITEA